MQPDSSDRSRQEANDGSRHQGLQRSRSKGLAFLVYEARSGSTLLASLLATVDGIDVTLESAFLARLIEARVLKRGLSTGELSRFLLAEDKLSSWGIGLEGIDYGVSERRSLHSAATAVFETAFPGGDTRCIVHKGVRLVPHLTRLALEFPAAMFVHIVRDPRSVAASQRRARTSSHGLPLASDVQSAARSWVATVRATAVLPAERLLEVRFEDLVREPEGTLDGLVRNLSSGLGLPLGVSGETSAAAPTAGPDAVRVATSSPRSIDERHPYFERIPEDQRHLHQNVSKRPDVERGDAWRRELTSGEVELVEHVAGSEMTRYGYAPSGATAGTIAGRARLAAAIGQCEVRRVWRRVRLLLWYAQSRERLLGRLRQVRHR